jgi:hypothetical protein
MSTLHIATIEACENGWIVTLTWNHTQRTKVCATWPEVEAAVRDNAGWKRGDKTEWRRP